MWLFTSTAALAITQSIGYWLHLSPLLAGCLTGLYLLWMTVKRLRTRSLKSKEAPSQSIALSSPATTSDSVAWKELRERAAKKIEGHGVAASLWFAGFMCIALLWTGRKLASRELIVTEHHVHIVAQDSQGDFDYFSDEKPTGDIYRPCQEDVEHGVDTVAFLREAIGYTAIEAKWIEKGTCKVIWPADCGFVFRDKRTDFKYLGGS